MNSLLKSFMSTCFKKKKKVPTQKIVLDLDKNQGEFQMEPVKG